MQFVTLLSWVSSPLTVGALQILSVSNLVTSFISLLIVFIPLGIVRGILVGTRTEHS